MRHSKQKVNANFSEWIPFERINSTTFKCERVSEQFRIRDVATFEINGNEKVRVSKIKRENL